MKIKINVMRPIRTTAFCMGLARYNSTAQMTRYNNRSEIIKDWVSIFSKEEKIISVNYIDTTDRLFYSLYSTTTACTRCETRVHTRSSRSETPR